jgi:hypothetical protein
MKSWNTNHIEVEHFLNSLLVIVVCIPSIILTMYLFDNCDITINSNDMAALSLNNVCTLGLHYPLLYVNILFFFNVCVLFWLLSLVQRSTWLIGK